MKYSFGLCVMFILLWKVVEDLCGPGLGCILPLKSIEVRSVCYDFGDFWVFVVCLICGLDG